MTRIPDGDHRGWIRLYGRYVFFSSDFVLALLAGLAVLIGDLLLEELQQVAREVLIATFAVSAGLLGLVMSAQAIFTNQIDGDADYRAIIDRNGGWDLATMPYTVTARVAGGTACWSLLAWVALPIFPPAGAVVALSGAVFGTVWTLLACIQVQSLTSWHGKQRHALQGHRSAAKTIVERRRSAK